MNEERISIEQVHTLPADIDRLVALSVSEGFRFLERLRDDWRSGTNRFSLVGEGFFVAHLGSELVGVCGLNRDPYSPDPGVGRLRRLYVAPQSRRLGVARRLVVRAMSTAHAHFGHVRLRTDDPGAARFYEALGFEPTSASPEATHETTPALGAGR